MAGGVVRGYLAYHAVATNMRAMAKFLTKVMRHWHRALMRREQRDRTNWMRMSRLARRWLPPVRKQHPWPEERFDVRTQGKSRMRSFRLSGAGQGGRAERLVPD